MHVASQSRRHWYLQNVWNTVQKTWNALDHIDRQTDSEWGHLLISCIIDRILLDPWPLWEELLCWLFHQAPPLRRLHRMALWNCHPHSHASPSHNPEATQQIFSVDKFTQKKLLRLSVIKYTSNICDRTYSASAQAFSSAVQPVQVKRFS